MDRTDEVGAAAAAEYFLSLYSYVMQTGDLAEWDAMSWETCNFCSSTRDRSVQIRKNAERFTGGEIETISVRVYPIDDAIGGYPVDVEFTQQPSAHVDASGTSIYSGAVDTGTFGVDVINVTSEWRILSVTDQGA